MSAPTQELGKSSTEGQDFVAKAPDGTPLTRFGAEIHSPDDVPAARETGQTADTEGQLELFQLPDSPTDGQGERVRATAKAGYEATNLLVGGAERMKRLADRINDASDRWNQRQTLGEKFDQAMSADAADRMLDRISAGADRMEAGAKRTGNFFRRIGRGALNQAREAGSSIRENYVEIKAENAKYRAERKDAALARKAERVQAREAALFERVNARFDRQAEKTARKEARADARAEKQAERQQAMERIRADRQERKDKKAALKERARKEYEEYYQKKRAARREKIDRFKDNVAERSYTLATRTRSIGRAALSPVLFAAGSIRENYTDHRVELAGRRADKLQTKAEKTAAKADKAQTKYAEKAYATNRY